MASLPFQRNLPCDMYRNTKSKKYLVGIANGGFPGGASGKEPANAGDIKRHGSDLRVRRIPWRRAWQPTPVFFPGESHEQRNLAGFSP